jgi:flagellar biosynthetic protein FliQ
VNLILALTDTSVLELATRTMFVTAKLSAPILVVSLAVGLAISLVQSVTQIQEVTLTFVPKLAAIGAVIIVSGHWMLDELVGFTHGLFDVVPQLIQ